MNDGREITRRTWEREMRLQLLRSRLAAERNKQIAQRTAPDPELLWWDDVYERTIPIGSIRSAIWSQNEWGYILSKDMAPT